jgi:hypothetical protein
LAPADAATAHLIFNTRFWFFWMFTDEWFFLSSSWFFFWGLGDNRWGSELLAFTTLVISG